HKMDVQVEDRLTGRATVGLNDVEAIGVDCALDCCGEPRCCPGELLGSDFIKCPNVGHMEAMDHKRVPEGSRIVREEGNDMLIAIDLASVGIVPVDNLAEGAIRIACRHCSPTS